MGLAAIVIALLGASEVSVAVVPGSVCVERASLSTRLETAGLRVVEGTSKRLAVTIRATPEGIKVLGARAGAAFERTVPAQSDACAAVERVVAALITSWSLQLPSAPAVARPVSPAQNPEPLAVLPEPPPEAAPLEVPPDEPPEVVSSPARKPLGEPTPKPVPLELAQLAHPEPTAWPMTFDLAALGGGSYGPTAHLAVVGQLQAALSFGRFGALLEGGLQSARSEEFAAIRIESTTQWLSLSARVHFQPLARLRLDLAAGFRVWRIAAQSLNALTPKSLELLGLGGVFSGGASVHLLGPVALQLRAFGSLRNNHPRFVIDGVGPVLDLQPFEAGLILGLEFRVFGGS